VASASETHLTCPSAQPDMVGASVFGIVSGTREAPNLQYLKRDALVDEATMRSLGSLDPTRVFRFSAKCEERRCAQFADGRCSLAKRIVAQLAPVMDVAPACRIRDTCRWHAEEGVAACRRCPQIATLVLGTRPDLAAIAVPPTSP
jgi:hypothetical protein